MNTYIIHLCSPGQREVDETEPGWSKLFNASTTVTPDYSCLTKVWILPRLQVWISLETLTAVHPQKICFMSLHFLCKLLLIIGKTDDSSEVVILAQLVVMYINAVADFQKTLKNTKFFPPSHQLNIFVIFNFHLIILWTIYFILDHFPSYFGNSLQWSWNKRVVTTMNYVIYM